MSRARTSSARSARFTRRSSLDKHARIGVVGATGAVGTVTLSLLRERGYDNVRAFASARSAGTRVGDATVEEGTPGGLARGGLDICFFSVRASASRGPLPPALPGGAGPVVKGTP